jgi:hypothetical protein
VSGTITLKLTEAERDALLDSLEHDERGARHDDPDAMLRLALVGAIIDRLSVAKVTAPRVAAPPPVEFEPATGDMRLDEYMRRSRAKNGPPKAPRAVPAPKFPFGLKVMDKEQRRAAIAFANAAVKMWHDRGHEVIISKVEYSRFDGEVAIDWRNVRVIGA